MRKKRLIFITMSVLLSVTAISGCETKNSILPETIVSYAMESENNVKSYYGESKIRVYDKDNKIVEENIMKEWQAISKDKMRVRIESYSSNNQLESISTNDGNIVMLYNIKEKKASTMKSLDDSDMPIRSQREQTKIFLENIKKSHNISTVGEEKVNGMDTYHIKAVPKEKNSIFSEQDIWIEKKNWFVVKCISHDLDSKIEIEYTKVDFSAKFKDEIFTQKVPEGVKVENIDNAEPKIKTITLKEVKEFLGKQFLYFPESSSYKIRDIKLLQYGSQWADDEITIDYEKDGKPYFNMTVRKNNKDYSNDEEIAGNDKVTIRGKEGFIFNAGISIIGWTEGDVMYSIIPSENVEDVKLLIKELDKMENFN
ncbi:outer membrane lipoprotein-sorting protein [uncultured Clostridium sp.]|uniref:LolA family protein n=1 Tax=uncultured Clostridium sp. TaxID=59620 RepID=UPI00258C2704|nr:outer membrane lipoprotein-sorting protein [uncultured Clostridium sp.]MDU1349978.1 outer membrane lipoprotein-sorting protein [Clostridium argentinense]